MTAVLERPRTRPRCEVCKPDKAAAWEYLGEAVDMKWLCAYHAEAVRQNMDHDPTHWQRLGDDDA